MSIEELAERSRSSPSRGIWSRFKRHRLATIGLIIMGALVATAALGPLVLPLEPYEVNLRAYRESPSFDHLLGTDDAGRDVFSRLVYGLRISLSVGLIAVSIYISIGVVLGSLAGFYGGVVDSFIMRLADVVMAFPTLMLIITVASIVSPSIFNIMATIGFLGWPPVARLVRGMILSLRERDHVLAARAIGASDKRLIFLHILPGVIGPLLVAATFGAASAILLEAGLSFIGLGVQAPTASLGNMLGGAQSLTILDRMPWLWVPPGLTIAVTVLSLNFIGDGVRDALDPHQTR